MKQHAFTKPAYTNEAEKEIIEQDENDRLAINERINYVFLNEKHQLTEEFPYDAIDLAIYINYLITKDDEQVEDDNELVFDDELNLDDELLY